MKKIFVVICEENDYYPDSLPVFWSEDETTAQCFADSAPDVNPQDVGRYHLTYSYRVVPVEGGESFHEALDKFRNRKNFTRTE